MIMALLNLYLTRANGEVIPYYLCSAVTLDNKPLWSGDWRNEFSLPDLRQTDLAVPYELDGAGLVKAHVLSPMLGGYGLKEGTVFTENNAAGFHPTGADKLAVATTDLQWVAPDSVLGKDLRQTELKGNFWIFTVKAGEATMDLPAEFVEGDSVSPGPPLGNEDDNAPALT